MKTTNKKSKTTSLLIATILLTGMIGSMGQSSHAALATADFESPLSVDDDVEGLDAAVIGLNIQSPDSRAIVIEAGASSGEIAYNAAGGDNACLDGQGMKVGPETWRGGDDAAEKIAITQKSTLDFTFDGKIVTFFNITAYDYGDYNPKSDASSGLVLTAYNSTDDIVATDTYSVPSGGDLTSYDACNANGIKTLSVAADGISRVELRPIGVGDPGVGFDNIKFERFAEVDVVKFYDANHNGEYDDGEEFLDGWLVNVNDTAFGYEYTNATYVLELDQNFTATEYLPNDYTWINTTNTSIQFNSTETDEILFSNVCVGESGENPHTKGFWSNKNGQALCKSYDDSVIEGNLTQFPKFVDSNNDLLEPIIDACEGVVHDKGSKTKNYLKKSTLGNINYTLSQQLLTMVLNNATESVNPEAEVYCHSIGDYFSLNSLMIAANNTLSEVGIYNAGDLAECLDDANNNLNYVQDTACPYDFETDVIVTKIITQNEILKTELIPEESYNYTITVTNNGDYPAVNANLYDVMGIGYQDLTPNPVDACWTGDSGIYSCDLGDLVDSVVLNIELFLEFDHSQSKYENQAIVNGTNFDEVDVWYNATVIED
jgi:hypothetical protein